LERNIPNLELTTALDVVLPCTPLNRSSTVAADGLRFMKELQALSKKFPMQMEDESKSYAATAARI
jgi:hypothetical protein